MFFESSIATDGSIIYRIPPPQPDSEPEFQNAKAAAVGVPMKRTGEPDEIAPAVLF